jgi:hypothetical protein
MVAVANHCCGGMKDAQGFQRPQRRNGRHVETIGDNNNFRNMAKKLANIDDLWLTPRRGGHARGTRERRRAPVDDDGRPS